MLGQLSAVGRQRLTRLVACAFTTNMALSGILVVLPLYATRILKLSNADYARVLSLRMAGITAGVILLGAISDRFGTRKLTVFSLLAGGIGFAVIGFVPLAGFLILIPVVSALVSTAFVNLNHLTQTADPERQGLANTLYRGTGAVAGILAPILITRLFDHVGLVLAGSGLALAASGLFIRSYPMEEQVTPFQGWSAEFRSMMSMYRVALGQKPLMRFIGWSLAWSALVAGVGTFIAIRLTSELNASTAFYGNTCAIAAAASLVGILLLGVWLDRMSIRFCAVGLYALSSVCAVGLGLTRSPVIAATLFVVFTLASTVVISPMSMWISREAEKVGLSLAFSVQKVLAALSMVLATLVLGFLEPRVGIASLLLYGGVLSLVTVGVMAFLREPPPWKPSSRPPSASASVE